MPPNSGRNNALNRAAFNLFQLVAAGGLDENTVRERLFAAAEACGLVAEDGAASVLATIESGARHSRGKSQITTAVGMMIKPAINITMRMTISPPMGLQT